MDAAEAEFRRGLALMAELAAAGHTAPEYQESTARLQGNLGQLLNDSGRLDEAESMFRQAVEARVKLFEQQPASLPLRGRLAHSWNNLGGLLRARQQLPEAASAFDSALKVLDPEAVKQAAPDTPEPLGFQKTRSHSWNNLGMVRKEQERLPEAEQAYRAALAIKERLVEKFPSVTQYRMDLAASLNNLGVLLTSLKRAAEGQAAFEKAVQLYERLSADAPDDPRYAVLLAGTYSNVGRMIGDGGELEKSLTWLSRSIDTLETAMRKDARVSKVRESLCVASWTRAMMLAGLERYSQALPDWDRAIEVDNGRYNRELRLRRASNLLQLRDVARATSEAAAIAESPAATADDLYNVACLYSLAATLTPEEAARAEGHSGQAVKLLRQAVDRGFRDVEHMRSDPDLESLHSREDFQRLCRELDAQPPRDP
jgi:tetratricopeptide (TPR) repeat protein